MKFGRNRGIPSLIGSDDPALPHKHSSSLHKTSSAQRGIPGGFRTCCRLSHFEQLSKRPSAQNCPDAVTPSLVPLFERPFQPSVGWNQQLTICFSMGRRITILAKLRLAMQPHSSHSCFLCYLFQKCNLNLLCSLVRII